MFKRRFIPDGFKVKIDILKSIEEGKVFYPFDNGLV